MSNKQLFRLIGQTLMMALAILVGGPAAMATVTDMAVTNTPQAEVTTPTETSATTHEGAPAAFPEQSVTTTTQAGAAPTVYEPDYDKELVKIRPTHTPIDTIGRMNKAKKTKSMEYNYGQVDYMPNQTVLSIAYTSPGTESKDSQEVELSVTNAGIFNKRDVIIVQGVKGYAADGVTESGCDLKVWVNKREGNSKLEVIAINGKKINNHLNCIPDIAVTNKLIRIAKACAELDSQAPGYAIYPKIDSNFHQKFMAQVEQSNIDAATAKRFDINLSMQEEAVLAQMRMDMEGAFLFGSKAKFTDPETQRYVWTTEGIWNQAKGGDFKYYPSIDHPFSMDSIIDITRMVFTGPSAGKSDKRIVVCGSKLLSVFEKTFAFANYNVNKTSRWNLEFTSVRTNFGELLFILDEVFDLHNMAGYGMIIDADYLERRFLEPFGRTTLDLDAQGVRDSKAIVLREISSMVLKAPKQHYRIIPDTSITQNDDDTYDVKYKGSGDAVAVGNATH